MKKFFYTLSIVLMAFIVSITSASALSSSSLTSVDQQRDQKKAVWVEMEGVTVPLPPKEHPRVFVRSEEIPALKAKMQTKEGKKILFGDNLPFTVGYNQRAVMAKRTSKIASAKKNRTGNHTGEV